MKPILFNTEMVKAILDGRKTVTRRVTKRINPAACCKVEGEYNHEFVRDDFVDGIFTGFVCRKCGYGVSPPHSRISVGESFIKPPYLPGDILYVRETWLKHPTGYEYLADGWQTGIVNIDGAGLFHWHPSIHMPKEAARIFLRVKDVRVERLQNMRLKDFLAEGVILTSIEKADCVKAPVRARERFFAVWNSTVKPADLPFYSWDANPWVWVIEFEQISKSKALEEEKYE